MRVAQRKSPRYRADKELSPDVEWYLRKAEAAIRKAKGK